MLACLIRVVLKLIGHMSLISYDRGDLQLIGVFLLPGCRRNCAAEVIVKIP